MEQIQSRRNHRILSVYMLLTCFFLIVGCKKENPNPELLDPIYQDLISVRKTAEKDLKDAMKKLEGIEKDYKTTEPRSLSRKTVYKDLLNTRKKVKFLEQRLKFTEIRVKRRKVEGRRKYRIAFQKGEVWPDPKEYEYYKQYNKLKNADLNWNKRVPKLHNNNPAFEK